MTTFSQLVDKVVLETSRPDMRDQICDYLNQTIREVHFTPDTGKAVFYESNYREVQVTATSEDGLSWSIPDVAVFQQELCVRFDNKFDQDGSTVYAQKAIPGPKMQSLDYFYYRGASSFMFGGRVGYGGNGAKVSIAYFEFPRGLVYYPNPTRAYREVVWNPITYAWDFVDDELTPDQQEVILAKYTNWILQRWEQVLLEGLRAKVYKRTGDTARQQTSYSLFKQGVMNLLSSESGEYGVYTT